MGSRWKTKRHSLDATHGETCACSNATRGNIDVTHTPQREERSDEAISGSGLASDAVHRMHAAGERQDVSAAVADTGIEAVCGAVTQGRRARRGSYQQHTVVLRRGGEESSSGRGGEPESVQSHQRVGKEDRSERCRDPGPVPVEGLITGGAHERTQPTRDEPSGPDARSAGQAAVGAEDQDQQPAFR